MNSTCSAIICHTGGWELVEHDIGAQCGATEIDRIAQVLVKVS